MSEKDVMILIKMDKKAYECIKNLDNLEEKEGIFPAIEAFNAFVEAVRDGKIVEVKCDLEKTADVAENVDGWCNTCKHKHHKSKCIYCAKYDEHDNLIALSNYESEEK